MLTLGSLFDGSGGFPLAAKLAGIRPVWASEIEPFPIRVTTKRIPEMIHVGSITEIHGDELPHVDIITFGSPCQNKWSCPPCCFLYFEYAEQLCSEGELK